MHRNVPSSLRIVFRVGFTSFNLINSRQKRKNKNISVEVFPYSIQVTKSFVCGRDFVWVLSQKSFNFGCKQIIFWAKIKRDLCIVGGGMAKTGQRALTHLWESVIVTKMKAHHDTQGLGLYCTGNRIIMLHYIGHRVSHLYLNLSFTWESYQTWVLAYLLLNVLDWSEFK